MDTNPALFALSPAAPVLVIRRARPKDAEAIIAIIRAAYAEYRGEVFPPLGAFTMTARSVRRQLRRQQIVYGLATVDAERPVATLRYRLRGKVAVASRLGVLPEMRGQGLAHYMMAWVEKEAKESGAKTIVGHVRLAIPALRPFYAHLGYRTVGFRRKRGFGRYLAVIRKRL